VFIYFPPTDTCLGSEAVVVADVSVHIDGLVVAVKTATNLIVELGAGVNVSAEKKALIVQLLVKAILVSLSCLHCNLISFLTPDFRIANSQEHRDHMLQVLCQSRLRDFRSALGQAQR